MTLLACFASWAVALPFGWAAAPKVVAALIQWSCPAAVSQLHYFSPLEVFIVNLRMGCVLAAALCYPYATYRIWNFLLPALYETERKAWRRWLISSSILFVAGDGFCVAAVLPLIMQFAASFATTSVTPTIGLSQFISLAGMLILGFGIMFQMPVAVCIVVRFNLVSLERLRHSRPYVIIIILIITALLTPPDVISQIMLAAPTWLLFELGIMFASQIKVEEEDDTTPVPPHEEPPASNPPPPTDTTGTFYESEYTR